MSARSIDELNVQIIAEQLGGGGHINSAGAQFTQIGVGQAMQKVRNLIDKMIVEGEI